MEQSKPQENQVDQTEKLSEIVQANCNPTSSTLKKPISTSVPPTKTWQQHYEEYKNREAEYRRYQDFMKKFQELCEADERTERNLNYRGAKPPPGFGTEKFELLEKFKSSSSYLGGQGPSEPEPKKEESDFYKISFRPGRVTYIPKKVEVAEKETKDEPVKVLAKHEDQPTEIFASFDKPIELQDGQIKESSISPGEPLELENVSDAALSSSKDSLELENVSDEALSSSTGSLGLENVSEDTLSSESLELDEDEESISGMSVEQQIELIKSMHDYCTF